MIGILVAYVNVLSLISYFLTELPKHYINRLNISCRWLRYFEILSSKVETLLKDNTVRRNAQEVLQMDVFHFYLVISDRGLLVSSCSGQLKLYGVSGSRWHLWWGLRTPALGRAGRPQECLFLSPPLHSAASLKPTSPELQVSPIGKSLNGFISPSSTFQRDGLRSVPGPSNEWRLEGRVMWCKVAAASPPDGLVDTLKSSAAISNAQCLMTKL